MGRVNNTNGLLVETILGLGVGVILAMSLTASRGEGTKHVYLPPSKSSQLAANHLAILVLCKNTDF